MFFNSSVFDTDGENHEAYQEIHKKYKSMVSVILALSVSFYSKSQRLVKFYYIPVAFIKKKLKLNDLSNLNSFAEIKYFKAFKPVSLVCKNISRFFFKSSQS